MASLGRHSSIKRTVSPILTTETCLTRLSPQPSAVNLDLAESDLPPPTRISEAVDAQQKEQAMRQLNSQLSDMPLRSPERLDPKEEELEAEDAREALQEAISGLALPDPERYMRANMRADGRKTPEPAFVIRGHISLQTDSTWVALNWKA
jgi:hypothetical protein